MSRKYISESYIEPVDSNISNNTNRSREIIKKDLKKEEVKLPTKLQMAKNASKSLLNTTKALISGDKVVATTEERDRRTSICKSCSWYIEKLQRCAKCGCVVPLKTYFSEESCPVDKW